MVADGRKKRPKQCLDIGENSIVLFWQQTEPEMSAIFAKFVELLRWRKFTFLTAEWHSCILLGFPGGQLEINDCPCERSTLTGSNQIYHLACSGNWPKNHLTWVDSTHDLMTRKKNAVPRPKYIWMTKLPRIAWRWSKFPTRSKRGLHFYFSLAL